MTMRLPFRIMLCFVITVLFVMWIVYLYEAPAPGLPPLHRVRLNFFVNGQPLKYADVSLVPLEKSVPWVMGGTTDKKGRVEIYTKNQYRGAPAGKMAVCVSKCRYEEGPTSKTPRPIQNEAQRMAWDKKCEEERKTFYIVGKEYEHKETTPLTFEVKAHDGNRETFNIP